MALADFVDNTSTAPADNTPNTILKVGTGTDETWEKVGVWQGTIPSSNDINLRLNSGSYAGDATGTKGGFAEKLVSQGATKFLTSDLLTQVNTKVSGFDQFVNGNPITYEYPVGTTKTAKPLQGIIAGRMLGNIGLTDDADFSKKQYNPAYSLDFLAGTSSYKPTTNIGLGDSCNLYPVDIGTTIGSGGGCPAGSFISYYKKPTFSGTITSTNNTNSQVVATCTKFNPSANPTNTGRCSTGRNLNDGVTVTFGGPVGDECQPTVPSNCTASGWYHKEVKSSYWSNGLPPGSNTNKCSAYQGYSLAFDGQCTSCAYGCPWYNVSQQPASLTTTSYKCTHSISTNKLIIKLPVNTLSGNIKWYDSSNNVISALNDQLNAEGCNGYIGKVIVTDLYGQFIEKINN